MSTIAHRAPTLRARVHRNAVAWLVGAILVAGVTILLALAVGGSSGESQLPGVEARGARIPTVPTPSPAQAAPSQRSDAPNGQTHGATPFSGQRP
jgi:hypothetical protein